jgi:hypothetical protein
MNRRQAIMLLASAAISAPAAAEPGFGAAVAAAAIAQTRIRTTYDPAYVVLDYPGGDVPADRGVCTDVIIRAMRAGGVDLQKLVHEDMRANFSAYPKRWGLKRPDRNIDHRRVPNLETFFTRAGARLVLSTDAADYAAGDIITWNLKGAAGYLPHIGVVTGRRGRSGRPLVVHNIGPGPALEDRLFAWLMTARFRYRPEA